MYRLVRISRAQGSSLYREFCASPAIARGCSACRYSDRSPASHMMGSSWTFQLTEPGPKRPRSGAFIVTQRLATRTEAPEGDLGLVDLVPDGRARFEARRLTYGAAGARDRPPARAAPRGE